MLRLLGGAQAPQDLACYVYLERNRTFAFWGRDSTLQLTGHTPHTPADGQL